MPRSLTMRVLLVEVATIVLAGLILWQITASALRGTAERYQVQELAGQALAISGGLRVDGDGRWSVVLPPQLRTIFETGYDGRYYAVIDATGRVLLESRFRPSDDLGELPREGGRRVFRRGAVIAVSQPATLGGRTLRIVVALDEGRPGAILDDVAKAFLLRYVAILVGLLLLLPMVKGVAIAHMVRAIRRVSDSAVRIGGTVADRRLEEGGLPSEVAPLVHATNDLLDRLEARLRAQAEFSGNIAHELRTPLATLKAQLDALQDAPLRERTIAQVDRIDHILSQLRDLGALEDADEASFGTVDLAGIAQAVVSETAPQAIASHHRVELESAGAVVVRGNAILVALALRNLVDNAIKHTPADTRVRVVAGQDGSLSVGDSGPGVLTGSLDQVTRRFWRADWSRTDGAGLGLSIVQRIMEVHGGRLELASGPGGATFRLVFARAPDRDDRSL